MRKNMKISRRSLIGTSFGVIIAPTMSMATETNSDSCDSWPLEDHDYPSGQKLNLPTIQLNRGDKVAVNLITADDHVKIMVDSSVVFESGIFYNHEQFVDITKYLPLHYTKYNNIFIDIEDYGLGGENFWSLKAALIINNKKCLINPINLHYRRVGQNNNHAHAIYVTRIEWLN
jgi:hypothetical protein